MVDGLGRTIEQVQVTVERHETEYGQEEILRLMDDVRVHVIGRLSTPLFEQLIGAVDDEIEIADDVRTAKDRRRDGDVPTKLSA